MYYNEHIFHARELNGTTIAFSQKKSSPGDRYVVDNIERRIPLISGRHSLVLYRITFALQGIFVNCKKLFAARAPGDHINSVL